MIGELHAIAAAVCWSLAAIFYKKGIRAGAIPAVLIRTYFALMFVFVMYLILRGWDFNFTLIGFALLNIGGILRLIIGGLAYMKGIENISVSRFIPILFTFPLLTILLSALFLNEEIHSEVIAGTGLIVTGIWILSRGKNIGNEKNVKLGVLFGILAAFIYSFSIIATKTGLNEVVDPFQSVLISMPVPLVLLYTVYSVNNGPATIFRFKKMDYILLGLGGIMGMGFGSYFFFVSMTHIGAAKATSLASITPFLSSILALVTLKEKISPALILGTCATVAGILVILN